jgi:hypothetical protein
METCTRRDSAPLTAELRVETTAEVDDWLSGCPHKTDDGALTHADIGI